MVNLSHSCETVSIISHFFFCFFLSFFLLFFQRPQMPLQCRQCLSRSRLKILIAALCQGLGLVRTTLALSLCQSRDDGFFFFLSSVISSFSHSSLAQLLSKHSVPRSSPKAPFTHLQYTKLIFFYSAFSSCSLP